MIKIMIDESTQTCQIEMKGTGKNLLSEAFAFVLTLYDALQNNSEQIATMFKILVAASVDDDKYWTSMAKAENSIKIKKVKIKKEVEEE